MVLRGARRPARVLDLEKPPDALFLRGRLASGPAVAIVGTRACTPEAGAFARSLASELAAAGVSILSGGAAGIDTEAHEGALDAGGHTTVVAPAGFDRPFPPENAGLFARVVEHQGAYLSTEPHRAPARRHLFFVRNAILAALAHAVVLVECPFRSGARNTTATARRLGRVVFAVPAAPWNSRGLGCIAELGLGARPLGSHRDVLRWLSEAGLHAVPTSEARAKCSPILRSQAENSIPPDPAPPGPLSQEPERPENHRVLAAVRAGAQHIDAICAHTGLSLADVHRLVLTLTLDGMLVCDHTGQIRCRDGS